MNETVDYRGCRIHVLYKDVSKQETAGCCVEKNGVEVVQWCPSVEEAKKGIDECQSIQTRLQTSISKITEEMLKAEERGYSRAIKHWTKEKPTVEGWYWFRDGRWLEDSTEGFAECVYIEATPDGMCFRNCQQWRKEVIAETGDWAGPISEPEA